PVPKVIDFGIAKATQARLTEKTLFTEFRQMIGTPEYMSPEQAEMSGLDVDTRADVYGLGVLLYELLTGSTPVDARELRSKAFGEMQRIIREVDPPRPSTRLSTLQTIASVAAQRGTDPRRLSAQVRGELDWIVMKCLEKDRTRRYESASALALDVQRHLADEPVVAAPPSPGYKMRKFVRRHRIGVAMSGAIVVALLTGIAVATWGLVRATRERDRAVIARIDAENARKSEAEAREYESATDKFLVDLFESIDPIQARGKPVLVQDILDRGGKRLDADPPRYRKTEGSLRTFFGRAYSSLGLHEQAYSQLTKAAEIYATVWGESDFRTGRVLGDLGMACLELAKLDEAERALTKAVEVSRRTEGLESSETLSSENALAALLVQRLKTDEADKLLAELLPRVRRVSGADSADTLSIVSVLVTLRERQGRFLEAESLLRDGLASAHRTLGDDHPYTLAFTNNLADVLRTQGKLADAAQIQRQAVDLARRVFGVDHPTTLKLVNNLGLILAGLGQHDEAEKLYLDVIERRRRLLGDEHPSTLTVRNNYALLLQNTGRLDSAEPIFRELVDRGRRILGENHPDTLLWTNNLAWLLVQRGDLVGAEMIYRDLIPRARQSVGDQHLMTLTFVVRHAHVMTQQGRWQEAEPLLAEAYAGATRTGFADSQAPYSSAYGVCLTKLGKFTDAIPILEQADRVIGRLAKPDPQLLRRVLESGVVCYRSTNQPDRAGAWQRRLDQLDRTAATTTRPATAP
ncbi:MAG: tetratricopeptide repeat protein, partial [Tepidisphaeraceae bacterium]